MNAFAGAEQHPLRYDDAAGAALFQQAVEVLDKEQLGLGGGKGEVLVDVALVDAAGKGRVGHDDVVFGLFDVAFAEGVLVVDLGLVDAVHHQVHQPQAHHGAVDVVAEEGGLQNGLRLFGETRRHRGADKAVLVGPQIFFACLFRQLGDDVLIGPQQKAAGTAGRIGDAVAELRLHQVGHQLDDVARGAELAVLAGGGDLGEEHLVDIALDILKGLALLLRVLLHDLEDLVDGLHGLHQQRRFGDDEHGVLHVVGEVGLGAVHVLEEGEDLALHMLEHLLGLHALELAPAQGALVDFMHLGINLAFVGLFLGVVFPCFSAVFRRYPLPFEFGGVGLAGKFGIGLLFLVQLVETLHEQQIGDLLDGGERVGDAAGPELVPELVDLASEFGVVLQHVLNSLWVVVRRQAARRSVSCNISLISAGLKTPRIPCG